MTETFSVEEAAQLICGADTPAAVKWLKRHLRGELQPVFPGYKERRKWRMTDVDIAQAIELLRPRRLPAIPVTTSMTRTSRRRLAS